MVLGSTHPLTEMSTGVFPGGKDGRCVRLTTFPPSCAVIMKSWKQLPGTLCVTPPVQGVPGLSRG